MKTCPRCGEKNHDALSSCAVCGRDLSTWAGDYRGGERQVESPPGSGASQAVVIASCIWGAPALLVPFFWVSRRVVKVNFADPVDVGTAAGWVAAIFCAGALAATLLSRQFADKQNKPPSLTDWMLTGLLATAMGLATALACSLLLPVNWWNTGAAPVADTIFETLLGSVAVLGLIVVPLVAVLTLPRVRQFWLRDVARQ